MMQLRAMAALRRDSLSHHHQKRRRERADCDEGWPTLVFSTPSFCTCLQIGQDQVQDQRRDVALMGRHMSTQVLPSDFKIFWAESCFCFVESNARSVCLLNPTELLIEYTVG